jgi:hypothetical protein
MVSDTPLSGRLIRAPWQLTVAQAVNRGSGEVCLTGDDGGCDIGVEGRGVEVMGKLQELEMTPRSNVPPAVLVGLEWPPEKKDDRVVV